MRRRSPLVVAALSVAVLLGGCADAADPANFEPNGLQEKSAIQIFQTGAQATIDASDIVVEGSVDVDGVPSEVVTRYGGTNAQALISTKKYDYEVVTNGGQIYVKGDVAFWTEKIGREQALKLEDKWAVSLIDGPLGQFSYFVDKNSYLRASGRIKEGDEVEVGGRPTIEIVDPPSNTDSTWWFATTGEPVLLRQTSGDATEYTFDYTQTNIIDLPPAGESIDVSSIEVPSSKQD